MIYKPNLFNVHDVNLDVVKILVSNKVFTIPKSFKEGVIFRGLFYKSVNGISYEFAKDLKREPTPIV